MHRHHTARPRRSPPSTGPGLATDPRIEGGSRGSARGAVPGVEPASTGEGVAESRPAPMRFPLPTPDRSRLDDHAGGVPEAMAVTEPGIALESG